MNLYLVARPLNRLRAILVFTMIGLFAIAFLMPWSRDLFDLPVTEAWAYGVGAAGIVAAWPLLQLGSHVAGRWHRR
jgi:hypothetical protein